MAGNMILANIIQSTSTSSGALVVTGGVGIGANLYLGGNLNVIGNTNMAGNMILANIIQSTSTSSGALVVTGGVGIGGNFNVGGNTIMGNVTFLSSISERNVSVTWGNPVTLNYNLGSVFWLGSVSSGTTFTVNISNLPNVTDATRSYIITLIYTTTAASQYCNSVGISTGTSYTTSTPKFNGGSASIVTAAGSVVTQQISLVYIYNTSTPILSTVSVFS